MADASRFVPIADTLNFRHVGGYPIADGRVTRPEMLFRSGWFGLPNEHERALFFARGIGQIFDFRSATERLRQPLEIPGPAAPRVVPLGITNGYMGPYIDSIAAMPPEQVDCKAAMARMYAEIPDAAEAQFRDFFVELLRAPVPTLIMCASGKDRTGVVTALLLAALGVDRETIMRDYLISAGVYRGQEDNFARRHRYQARGIPIELISDVLTVHSEYLEAFWARIEEKAGGVAGYLRDNLGLSDHDLETLRRAFTA